MNTTAPMPRVLDLLPGHKRAGKGFSARCPGHDDHNASLSITAGDDGRVLLRCHAGCSVESICTALGLTLSDLFVPKANGHGQPAKHTLPRRVAATYDYRDENGDVLYQAVRYEPKDFRQRRPDGSGGWLWNLEGVQRVLYKLPELLNEREDREGEWRFVCEGEKDVENIRAAGGIATCNVGGAGKWKDEYSGVLTGEKVCIVADKDDAGRKHAHQVAASLQGKAREVKVIELPGDGVKDASDYLASGGTLESIVAMADTAPPWAPATDEAGEVEKPADNGQGLTKRLADAITATDHFAKDVGGRLYIFTEGVYRPTGEAHVARLVKQLLNKWEESESWSTRRESEVAAYIRVDAPVLWDRPPLDRVNVLNGIIDVATRTLRRHDPAFLSPVQIPVKFDPTATCPVWERFILSSFPADAADVAWEIIGWLMLPDVSIQKAVLLIGEGSNGKSVYLQAVITFLGKRNVVTLPLHRLESDKFSVSRLVGKLANVCADLPSAHLAGTSMFKALVGGDTITGERKHVDSFDFDPYARLIFSANHPPRSEDASHAFFRRWIVIPFGRTFTPDDPDFIPRDVLDAQLAEPAEQSGVLNKALDGLARIKASRGITESASMREAWAEFRETTDPLAVWLDANTTHHPEIVVPKSELHSAFNQSRKEVNEPTMTATAFGLAIRRLRPTLKDAQRTINGRLAKVWLGIGLRASPASPGSPGSPNCAYLNQPSFEGYVEGR